MKNKKIKKSLFSPAPFLYLWSTGIFMQIFFSTGNKYKKNFFFFTRIYGYMT